MKYQLNDKPGPLPLILYGLQWLAVSIPSIIIIGNVTAGIHGISPDAQVLYLQKVFGIMGVALVVQVLTGHRLPLVIGPASVLLIGILGTSGAGTDSTYTAITLGGLMVVLLAYTGIFSRLNVLFTPRIVIVILELIAFTLSPTILKLIWNSPGDVMYNLSVVLGLCILMFLANSKLRGIWKSMTVVWGLIAGCLAVWMIYGMPEQSHSYYAETPWKELFPVHFTFDAGVILSFFFCFIALSINELGSIQSVGKLIGADRMDVRTKKGVGLTGVFNMLSGVLGVIGPVDYSMSPGVISATGCASRYPFIPAGIVLVLLAFCPPLVAGLTLIPGLVMGTLLLYLMGTQLSAAVQMLTQEKAIMNFNDGIIICFPLMIAILFSFAPQESLSEIPAIIRPILGNGFVMGVITALLLEHVIFRRK